MRCKLSQSARAGLLLATGCALQGAASGPTPPVGQRPINVVATDGATEDTVAPGSEDPSDAASLWANGPVPIEDDDAIWGGQQALVTVVGFLNYQCPFTARAWKTLGLLGQHYGDELRFVFKHLPLPFHKEAEPTAIAAQVVLDLGGTEMFLRYSDLVFAKQRELSPESRVLWAAAVGLDSGRFQRAVAEPRYADEVARDQELATEVGAKGTPHFLINGVRVTGAQKFEKFVAVIDEELLLARALRDRGFGVPETYQQRVAANYQAGAAAKHSGTQQQAEDTRVYRIPVGSSPVQGPADALVTIVEFADLQCPYSSRVQATLAELRRKYPTQLRIVFKHNPLAFHRRARPAANFAIYALKHGGSRKFFKAVGRLFAEQRSLDEATMRAVAVELGLNPGAALAAVAADRYGALIDDDQQLADAFEARGTPQFFINGRCLLGAQPLEKFVTLVEDRLAEAARLAGSGTPRSRVYAQIMKSAEGPPPPAQLALGPPPAYSPSLGVKHAPLVVQIAGGFECPYTARVWPTIEQLRRAYPGRMRLVWRHLPMPFHKRSIAAAEAAMEVYDQKGSRAFWKMVEVLLANQARLTDRDLERYAAAQGVDRTPFRKAMADGKHRAVILADRDQLQQAGLKATPAVAVRGYTLSGAHPLSRFKRLMDYALKHPTPPTGAKQP